jgi:hypothetical protein
MGFSESLLNPSNFKAEDKMTLLFDRINFAGYIYTRDISRKTSIVFTASKIQARFFNKLIQLLVRIRDALNEITITLIVIKI